MTTVVVWFTDDPQGHRALDLAVQEAHLRDARLVVVHSMKGGTQTTPDEVMRSRQALDLVAKRLDQENLEHQVNGYVRGHTPVEDLMAAAKESDADLIVIGYRKRSSAGKFLLGSHAHDILMHAQCPVLAVVAG